MGSIVSFSCNSNSSLISNLGFKSYRYIYRESDTIFTICYDLCSGYPVASLTWYLITHPTGTSVPHPPIQQSIQILWLKDSGIWGPSFKKKNKNPFYLWSFYKTSCVGGWWNFQCYYNQHIWGWKLWYWCNQVHMWFYTWWWIHDLLWQMQVKYFMLFACFLECS